MSRRKFNNPDRIRKTMIKEGEKLFSRYGLKKTRVEEITEASGIGKGSFYKFFSSKEELYFEIVEQQEEHLQEQVLRRVSPLMGRPDEFIRELIKEGFRIIEEYPILRDLMDPDTYRDLANKLPEEKLQAHQQHDQEKLFPLIRRLQEGGMAADEDPAVITALFRGIFMLALHRKEIGENEFSKVINLLAKIIGRGLIQDCQEKK